MATSLVQEMLMLFVGGAPAPRTYRVNLAGHVHAAAALEDLARRGGPRTAREYSERDWMRQCLDPDVLAAQVAAWNEYREGWRHEARSLHPRRAPRRRRPTLADLYATAVVGDGSAG